MKGDLQSRFNDLGEKRETISCGIVSVTPYKSPKIFPISFKEYNDLPIRMFTTIGDEYIGHFESVKEIKEVLKSKIDLYSRALEDLQNE